jgi:pimeloyl-ACP methyl ester carboxylesterase
MSQIISNGKLVEIPSATHPVHTDNPTKFQEAVLEFLNDCCLIDGERIF